MENVQSNVQSLPIFKHFGEGEIAKQVDTFRKGEKNLFWFIKLGALIAVGYALWVYILPPILQIVGRIAGIAAGGIFIVFIVLMLPVIFKGLRILTRAIHKTLIRYDPFETLEKARDGMLQNKQKFIISKGQIDGLRSDMEIEAAKNKRDAEKDQAQILKLQKQAQDLKTHSDKLLQEGGVAAKEDDEYVNTQSELFKIVSQSGRVAATLQQEKDFIIKYSTRAVTMKKFSQKLTMVETSMDIKILDFDATIEILKKDFIFAEKSKNATETAKSAMLFTKGWELEYAIDVVASTISADVAITASNLKDIDSLTKNYDMNSDDLYNNLDTLANNIRVGTDVVPDTKKYKNPDYVLTSDDKLKGGEITSIF